jgi:hypothetical protein
MTTDFWSQFYGEKLLIYNQDSVLCDSPEVLEYDYIGAPWKDDNFYGLGNGGFSLRSKSIMIEVIDKIKLENLIVDNSTIKYIEEPNETNYVDMILSIIDYDFIRRTDTDLANLSDEQIKYLFLTGKDDIIVSQTHAQLITQNDLFEYDFYKSHYHELAHMNPSQVLNHYLLYGKARNDIISHEHAQYLNKNIHYNIDFNND